MATITFTVPDVGSGNDVAAPIWARFFVAESGGDAWDWALPSGKWAVFRVGPDDGDGIDAAPLTLRPYLPLSDLSEGIDAVALPIRVVALAAFALADLGDGYGAATFYALAMKLALADTGDGADDAAIGQIDLPDIPDPLPVEIPGGVNVVRNPSLEYADVGLADWFAESGALGRVSGDAWDGGDFGRVSGEAGKLAVRSASGLRQPSAARTAGGAFRMGGYGAGPIPLSASVAAILQERFFWRSVGDAKGWVGSISLRVPHWAVGAFRLAPDLRSAPVAGAAAANMREERVFRASTPRTASITLAVLYEDGTASQGQETAVALTDDWQRFETAPTLADPRRVVTRLDLRLNGVGVPAGGWFDADGVQIEREVEGGATPYLDGDQGEGHGWAGAPGFSTSYRVATPA